ncbi:MAG: phospholipase D-like domain-containing protein, partial [Spirochaetaceae bacterium]|nr:phospholipase D-like domain-containing protein [Spirochaetaceae bacterium]
MTGASIIDNRNHGAVGAFLKERLCAGADLSIVSAYFTIHAFAALKEELGAINHLRFLFGEPTFVSGGGVAKTPRAYKFEDDRLDIAADAQLSQKAIARQCAQWLREKAEVRSMVKPNFLHGKMYYIKPEGKNTQTYALTGSSNFTVHGLGLSRGENKNIELNLIAHDDHDRAELAAWFDELWNESADIVEDVKDKVIQYISTFYADNPPQFVYYKTLYHIFKDYLEDAKKSAGLVENQSFLAAAIWNKLYDFQKDGVKGAIHKIEKYGGCII